MDKPGDSPPRSSSLDAQPWDTQQPLPLPPDKRVIRIFCCYAREDEELLEKLKTQLSPLQREGLLQVWYDRDINAGAEWESEVKEHLNTADIILLLVSPDFLNSDYCYGVEMKRALERHEKGEVQVIPIILRPAIWERVLGKLQALPTDTIPVTSKRWESEDAALYSVAAGIQNVVERLLTKPKVPKNPFPPLPPWRPSPSLKRSHIAKIALVCGLVFLLIGAGLLIYFFAPNPRSTSLTSPTPTPKTSVSTTASVPAIAATLDTALSNPYPPNQGTLALNTSLTSVDSRWDTTSSCHFTNQAYAVTASYGVTNCLEDVDSYNNFVYQVQMKFLTIDTCGGILLRVQTDPTIARSYEFYLCTDNTYHFGYNIAFFTSLVEGASNFKTQVGQVNVIAVAARGTQFLLYINGQLVNKANDNKFSIGGIGVSVRYLTNPGASHQVAFNEVKVWKL